MNDTSNRLIGWPIMRQLRVKSSSCYVQTLHLKCTNDYNLFNEELDTYVYVGTHGSYNSGGYVYEF
jgi:Polycystin cation channel